MAGDGGGGLVRGTGAADGSSAASSTHTPPRPQPHPAPKPKSSCAHTQPHHYRAMGVTRREEPVVAAVIFRLLAPCSRRRLALSSSLSTLSRFRIRSCFSVVPIRSRRRSRRSRSKSLETRHHDRGWGWGTGGGSWVGAQGVPSEGCNCVSATGIVERDRCAARMPQKPNTSSGDPHHTWLCACDSGSG